MLGYRVKTDRNSAGSNLPCSFFMHIQLSSQSQPVDLMRIQYSTLNSIYKNVQLRKHKIVILNSKKKLVSPGSLRSENCAYEQTENVRMFSHVQITKKRIAFKVKIIYAKLGSLKNPSIISTLHSGPYCYCSRYTKKRVLKVQLCYQCSFTGGVVEEYKSFMQRLSP